MEKNDLLQHKKLLRCLSSIPKQILTLQAMDNVPEFVLHGLCSKDCFNLYKAAYFVDNPDFDMIKGIAGFSKEEGDLEWDNIWEDPESFSLFTKSLPFNKRVRTFGSNSIKRTNNSYESLIKNISSEIGFDNPAFCLWEMRHFNHGILVYEKINDENTDLFNDHFANSLYLLNFCPF
jgi:hypothetical protein